MNNKMAMEIILAMALAGCTSSAPVLPRASPPRIPPSATPAPVLSHTPTPQNTCTPTPGPSPTPTFPPYHDRPFTAVFYRDGNLWISEIGGAGESQLTFESEGWMVEDYAISPACDRVAYIACHSPPGVEIGAHIKQVDLRTGAISVLTGANDPINEYSLNWLDNDHITYAGQVSVAPGYTKETLSAWEKRFASFHHIVFDLVSGEKTSVPESMHLSQSPDGRYWLSGSGYPMQSESTFDYVLHDLSTGEQWRVAEKIGWGVFLGWSPDSRWMLFATSESLAAPTVQLVLIDVATREERQIMPGDQEVRAASWSPDGQSIALIQCDVDDCALWVMDRDGSHLRRIPTQITNTTWDVDWTPDGLRLVFISDEGISIVWSVRLDGTDLRPIIYDASMPRDLCEP